MPGLTSAELQDILTFTIGLAHRAGALILEGSHAIQRAGAGDVGAKKNAIDLVTEYDVRVEELVRSEIAQAYPDFHLCVPSRRMRDRDRDGRASWCVVSERSRTPQASDPRSQTPRHSASTRSVSSSALRTTQAHIARAVTDGTTNFVHGFPFACISLGLIDRKSPVLGVPALAGAPLAAAPPARAAARAREARGGARCGRVGLRQEPGGDRAQGG
ncbi:hypothetical protein BC834DRAFT_48156 [Gloeopeniophorella convolvens]|nr:hypothetical protein BC834DRAFT_48156 [Gloeopeniophorella convolvens]